MVDYNIFVPQPYDNSSDIANALRFRAQQQAEAENQLKLQAWQEDRAYQLEQRKAAAANAATAKERENKLLGIYGEYGVTPAVVGTRGAAYSGTGVANNPDETLFNNLVRGGYISAAKGVSEARSDFSKSEVEKLRLDATKYEDALNRTKQYIPMIKTADDVARYTRLKYADPVLGPIASKMRPEEEAVRLTVDQFNKDPQGTLSALAGLTGADIAKQKFELDKQNAELAKINAETEKANAEARSKGADEFVTVETAQGVMRMNKRTGETTPVQVGGETAMPFSKSPVTNINTNLPASEQAQKEYMTTVAKQRETFSSAPATLENIEKAKELIPEAKTFMGTGGEAYLTVAKFLNNRLGTDINVSGVKSAEELRSRLFMGVMDNLKKMDAQPTGRQQEALQEAIGQLDTDPNALPQILDILGDALRTKVDIYNKDVSDAEARGVKFPYKPQVDLPAQKVVGENTFPSEAAASQILKQRGAKPGDRVRVNIGGRTGTFVVE